MPDYRVRLLHDVLEVSPKDEFLKVYQESADNGPEASVRLSPETYEKAREVAPSWDIHFLEQEWRMWMSEPPRHADGAFLGLPSVSKAKSAALKDAPRVQFSFTSVPKPIKDAFDQEAKKRGLSKKELLYACLRSGGIEIPDSEEIDGRRR